MKEHYQFGLSFYCEVGVRIGREEARESLISFLPFLKLCGFWVVWTFNLGHDITWNEKWSEVRGCLQQIEWSYKMLF